METIHSVTAPWGVYVVEDMAELHGVAPSPDSDAACWSFYRNKVVAGEEGGAVAHAGQTRAYLARQLRCLGFTAAHDFVHQPRGHNYRLAPSLAERVLHGLKYYPAHLMIRRQLEKAYEAACPPEWRLPPRQSPWVYDLRIPGLTRDRQRQVVTALHAEGIEARMSFAPMSWQPEFSDLDYSKDGYTAAEKASREVFYLPLTPGEVTEEMCDRAFRVIHRVLG